MQVNPCLAASAVLSSGFAPGRVDFLFATISDEHIYPLVVRGAHRVTADSVAQRWALASWQFACACLYLLSVFFADNARLVATWLVRAVGRHGPPASTWLRKRWEVPKRLRALYCIRGRLHCSGFGASGGGGFKDTRWLA